MVFGTLFPTLLKKKPTIFQQTEKFLSLSSEKKSSHMMKKVSQTLVTSKMLEV